jgi:hypothetical protein
MAEAVILLFRHDMASQLQCSFGFPARLPCATRGHEAVGHNGKTALAASSRVSLNVKHA